MAFITPLLIRIPFGVRLFRFTEKPPYGIKNERLRAIVERQMKEGESSEAGLLTMEGVTVRELHWMNAVVKKRMPQIKVPALVLHSIEDDITSRWNADYVERHLGGPVTKILLDNCYHMITVDLQYRRVIELSADFVEQHAGLKPTRVDVGAGLPAMRTPRSINETEAMPSQASQLPHTHVHI
jgi:carboxylesterase